MKPEELKRYEGNFVNYISTNYENVQTGFIHDGHLHVIINIPANKYQLHPHFEVSKISPDRVKEILPEERYAESALCRLIREAVCDGQSTFPMPLIVKPL